MTAIKTGDDVTADLLNDETVDTSTTSGLTASTGFTVSSFAGYRKRGLCTITCFVTRSGADITATSGNIADTSLCTVPSGYRPPVDLNGTWDNGATEGEATITTAGVVTLRTSLGNIVSGTNVRFNLSYVNPQ